ncbi:MAG: trypsin-like peptidase domain-containing protein [Candidatus Moranbacteria bacterium]|nr:trypsin-like peptidase domain-containing protein [Candidatus Moranbacteria bacterium]
MMRGALLFLGVLFVVGIPTIASAEGELSEEALADLVKPSVVRIAEHVTGTAKIPAVKVDIRQGLVAVIPDRFTEVPIDEYLTGSGFIIHPDGYIATNAHVVSLETIKNALAGESALSAIFENALLLSDEEMQTFLDSEGRERFSQEIIEYIIDHGEFALEHDIAVLRPDATQAPLGRLMESGFPAEIVSVNEDFIDDERDVALLKIEETNLPALSLGDGKDFSVGKKVFIFGFPATAEINEKSPGEATFTKGVVSAIKQSSDGKLKIFQTDAKVSQGSSGGPLFDERGEVIGLVTFQTDELSRTTGDNFAFALPIDIVKKQALEARILPEEGIYGQSFRLGFASFLEKHCDSALSFFETAKETNQVFFPEASVSSYQEKCHEWQSAGQARDTYWDEFRDGVNTLGSPLLYIIGGTLFSFGILGAMMFWLLRQLRREEREIGILEHRIRADERELHRHEADVLKKEQSLMRPRPLRKKL